MAPKVAEKAVKAPATKAPAAKKVVKKATKSSSKKKVKAVESYKIYIYKVLKQVRPSKQILEPVITFWNDAIPIIFSILSFISERLNVRS